MLHFSTSSLQSFHFAHVLKQIVCWNKSTSIQHHLSGNFYGNFNSKSQSRLYIATPWVYHSVETIQSLLGIKLIFPFLPFSVSVFPLINVQTEKTAFHVPICSYTAFHIHCARYIDGVFLSLYNNELGRLFTRNMDFIGILHRLVILKFRTVFNLIIIASLWRSCHVKSSQIKSSQAFKMS